MRATGILRWLGEGPRAAKFIDKAQMRDRRVEIVNARVVDALRGTTGAAALREKDGPFALNDATERLKSVGLVPGRRLRSRDGRDAVAPAGDCSVIFHVHCARVEVIDELAIW